MSITIIANKEEIDNLNIEKNTGEILKDINLYGLGNVRTLKQWEAKLNIDLRNKYIGESAKTRIYY